MSTSTTRLTQRQISRARSETETSLAGARSLRDQWLVATGQNPTGLTQKEIDHLGKTLKNRLLTLKWDCEDLEELVNGETNDRSPASSGNSEELASAKYFIQDCRDEIATCMGQLEDYELGRKLFTKHGITTNTTLPNNIVAQAMAPVTSIIQNPLHGGGGGGGGEGHYERLSNEHLDAHDARPFDATVEQQKDDDGELPHFDKSLIEPSSATIFTNALYEHYEEEDALTKTINATKVFNNLTRPSADDMCVGTNENEMILEMLETEYYNPPAGLLAKTGKFNSNALRTFFDADRNKFLGTIAFIFSFPILLILFLVI